MVHELSEHKNPMLQGSLSEKEYHDPAKVFRKAFKKYRLEAHLELVSLGSRVYFSLGTFNNVPERNIS